MSANGSTEVYESVHQPPSSDSHRSYLRPWSEFFEISAISLPSNLFEASERIKINYFRFPGNYAAITVLIFILSLLHHPFWLIAFSVLVFGWVFLYVWRADPLVIFGWTIEEGVVLIALVVSTVLSLLLARAWWNLLISFAIGAPVFLLHAVFRAANDASTDQYGPMLSGGDSPRGSYANI